MNEDTASAARHSQVHSALEALIRGLPRGTHLTAPEVYRRARESGLKVSLSTVYRKLHQLSSQGHVQALAGEHGRRYEASEGGHDHDHLICVKCGFTVEFEDDLIAGFGRSVAERKGYDYRSSRFDILGICKPCKVQGDDHKIESSIAAIEKILELTGRVTDELDEAAGLLESRRLSRGRESLKSVLPVLVEMVDELRSALELFRDDQD